MIDPGTDIDASVGEALDAGLTLPAEWYSDPEIHRLERDRIFARSWQYAARLEQLAEPRSFVATRAGHIPVVIVRHQDGDLRAFVSKLQKRLNAQEDAPKILPSSRCPKLSIPIQFKEPLMRVRSYLVKTAFKRLLKNLSK